MPLQDLCQDRFSHKKGELLKNSLSLWPKEWPVVHSHKTVQPYHVSNTTMQIKLIDFLAASQRTRPQTMKDNRNQGSGASLIWGTSSARCGHKFHCTNRSIAREFIAKITRPTNLTWVCNDGQNYTTKRPLSLCSDGMLLFKPFRIYLVKTIEGSRLQNLHFNGH